MASLSMVALPIRQQSAPNITSRGSGVDTTQRLFLFIFIDLLNAASFNRQAVQSLLHIEPCTTEGKEEVGTATPQYFIRYYLCKSGIHQMRNFILLCPVVDPGEISAG